MPKTLFLFRDENGRSALFLAVSGQHAESAQVLLQAGKQFYLTSTKVVHEKYSQGFQTKNKNYAPNCRCF